jgi:hypothetical protein
MVGINSAVAATRGIVSACGKGAGVIMRAPNLPKPLRSIFPGFGAEGMRVAVGLLSGPSRPTGFRLPSVRLGVSRFSEAFDLVAGITNDVTTFPDGGRFHSARHANLHRDLGNILVASAEGLDGERIIELTALGCGRADPDLAFRLTQRTSGDVIEEFSARSFHTTKEGWDWMAKDSLAAYHRFYWRDGAVIGAEVGFIASGKYAISHALFGRYESARNELRYVPPTPMDALGACLGTLSAEGRARNWPGSALQLSLDHFDAGQWQSDTLSVSCRELESAQVMQDEKWQHLYTDPSFELGGITIPLQHPAFSWRVDGDTNSYGLPYTTGWYQPNAMNGVVPSLSATLLLGANESFGRGKKGTLTEWIGAIHARVCDPYTPRCGGVL